MERVYPYTGSIKLNRLQPIARENLPVELCKRTCRGKLLREATAGSGETLSMHTLSQWIASFRAENPLVQYDIYSATADEIKDRIEKGILDMGLLVEPVDIAKYEFIRMPMKERWGYLGFQRFSPCPT